MNYEQRVYTFKTVGGLSLRADVHVPVGAKNNPVVMFFHGGAAILGSRTVKPGQLALYMRRGYTIVSPDYRFAPETKLPEIVQDTIDAYHWVIEKGPALFAADPTRIAVTGFSFGGYLTELLGTMLSPSPRALVAYSGYCDLLGEMLTTPSRHYLEKEALVDKAHALSQVGGRELCEMDERNRKAFYLYTRQQAVWLGEVTGFDPDTQADQIAKYCSVRNMTKDYPPLLLTHGVIDTDVSYIQSQLADTMLTALGVQHQFITLPCGHGVRGPEGDAAFEMAGDFLDKHLR